MIAIRSFLRGQTVKTLLGALVLVLILLPAYIGWAHLPFYLVSHGHLELAIPLLTGFYEQMSVGIPTLGWYAIAVLLFALGWKVTGRITTEWLSMLIRLGLTTILSPGIFLETGTSDSLILPVLVCIAKYVPLSDAILYSPSHRSPFVLHASGLAFWPTPVVWFLAISMALVHRWWRITRKVNESVVERR